MTPINFVDKTSDFNTPEHRWFPAYYRQGSAGDHRRSRDLSQVVLVPSQWSNQKSEDADESHSRGQCLFRGKTDIKEIL